MKRLNNILKKFIEEYNVEDFSELSFISNLTSIIDNYPIKLKQEVSKKYVSINKSFNYSYEFLKTIDKRYADYLLKIKNEGVFDITQGNEEYPYSNIIDGKSYIYMPIYNNIGDTYAITHETIHDMSAIDGETNLNRYLFCEVFSLLAEMLQRDYFYNTSRPKEYNLNNNSILRGIYSKKRTIMLELNLIRTYLEYGYIDNQKIFDILGIFNSSELTEISYKLHFILEHEELSYGFEQRYIIGYLIASYMHDRILKNPRNICEFIELNDNLNNYEVQDFLDYLELDYEDSKILNLKETSYQKLRNSFVNELKRR